jgi:hypothetical protein
MNNRTDEFPSSLTLRKWGHPTSVSLEAMMSLYLQAGMLGLTEAVLETIVTRQIQHDLLTLKDVLEARAF